ncbi:hypothetical protein EZMO1_4694 [Endozoicomonas montiporae CL-33]|uniref:Uncharacterized protein n=1 Tax=Endozoicomonas montiporae CL-33 TaxID=570277 RepID=A0A142BIM1_9GAMM|nr:hypothetical protein EZMO1_4694 [Endozoicomonas montiporae CL-33]
MLIHAEQRFITNQWAVINMLASFLGVPATQVRITRLTNDTELGLCIEGEYRNGNSQNWQPFRPMTRLHSQHPYQQQQRQQ